MATSLRQPRTSSRLRLTGRGRVVVVVVSLMVSLGLVLATSRASSTATEVQYAPALRAITVAPGQTLWQIAEAVDPSADPRQTVERLVSLNGFSSPALAAGQQILVPALVEKNP
jgi:LysM repeat protein